MASGIARSRIQPSRGRLPFARVARDERLVADHRRPHQAGDDHDERILVKSVAEDERRDEDVEQPAEHAADREAQVELSKLLWRRPILGELAVTQERHIGERRYVQQELEPRLAIDFGDDVQQQEQEEARLEEEDEFVRAADPLRDPEDEQSEEGKDVEDVRRPRHARIAVFRIEDVDRDAGEEAKDRSRDDEARQPPRSVRGRRCRPHDRPAREDEDEREQVDGQRDDPEERDRRDVGGHERRQAEHQARRNRRQRDPADAPKPRHADVRRLRFRRRLAGKQSLALDVGGDRRLAGHGRLRRQRFRRRFDQGGRPFAQEQHADAAEHQGREHAVAEAPDDRLLRHRERRLHEERIENQGQHAAEVRGPVEEVRILGRGMAGEAEPSLEQRRRGRDDEERHADDDRQDPEHGQNRIRVGRRRPVAERERQEQERPEEHERLEQKLAAAREPGADEVRVGVTGQEHALEEDHARVPHRRRAAEQRQDHLADHRLDEEQERGAREERQREVEQHEHGSPDARRRGVRTILLPLPALGERVGVRGRSLAAMSSACLDPSAAPDGQHRRARDGPSPPPSPPKRGEGAGSQTWNTPVLNARPESCRVATASASSSTSRVRSGSMIASTHSRAAP